MLRSIKNALARLIRALDVIWLFFSYYLPVFVRNIRLFATALAKYRDWDHCYCLEMYKRSLEILAFSMKHDSQHEDKEVRIKEIKRMITYIDNMKDPHGAMEDEWDEFYEKHDMYMPGRRRLGQKKGKEYWEEFGRLTDKESKIKEESYAGFVESIRKYSEGWWH
jgi:hypothetical protein